MGSKQVSGKFGAVEGLTESVVALCSATDFNSYIVSSLDRNKVVSDDFDAVVLD